MSGALARFDDHLRTPRGQLTLLAVGYALAAALAVTMAANRAWFESKRAERLDPVPASVAALASDLDLGRATAREVAQLPEHERSRLYDAWLASSGLRGPGLPRALAEVAPAQTRERVERTLCAGDPEQRRRAIELARLSGSDELLGALGWARERARRLRDDELARALADGPGANGSSDERAGADVAPGVSRGAAQLAAPGRTEVDRE